jgi:hypothetical protein
VQISAQSDDIKDLKQKIQAAYMNKKRDDQIKEAKQLEDERKVLSKLFDVKLLFIMLGTRSSSRSA